MMSKIVVGAAAAACVCLLCPLGLADPGPETGPCDSCGPAWMTNTNPPYKGFARGWAMISAEELKELWDRQQAWDNRDTISSPEDAPKRDPKLVIIDVAKPMLQYRGGGHIPGAYNTWRPDYASEETFWEEEVWAENLLDRADFQEFLRSFGIDNDSQVVFYDHKYDATRLWWACKLYGFDTRVLDGGIDAWKAAGYDVNRVSSGSARTTRCGICGTSAARPRWKAAAIARRAWERFPGRRRSFPGKRSTARTASSSTPWG